MGNILDSCAEARSGRVPPEDSRPLNNENETSEKEEARKLRKLEESYSSRGSRTVSSMLPGLPRLFPQKKVAPRKSIHEFVEDKEKDIKVYEDKIKNVAEKIEKVDPTAAGARQKIKHLIRMRKMYEGSLESSYRHLERAQEVQMKCDGMDADVQTVLYLRSIKTGHTIEELQKMGDDIEDVCEYNDAAGDLRLHVDQVGSMLNEGIDPNEIEDEVDEILRQKNEAIPKPPVVDVVFPKVPPQRHTPTPVANKQRTKTTGANDLISTDDFEGVSLREQRQSSTPNAQKERIVQPVSMGQ